MRMAGAGYQAALPILTSRGQWHSSQVLKEGLTANISGGAKDLETWRSWSDGAAHAQNAATLCQATLNYFQPVCLPLFPMPC